MSRSSSETEVYVHAKWRGRFIGTGISLQGKNFASIAFSDRVHPGKSGLVTQLNLRMCLQRQRSLTSIRKEQMDCIRISESGGASDLTANALAFLLADRESPEKQKSPVPL